MPGFVFLGGMHSYQDVFAPGKKKNVGVPPTLPCKVGVGCYVTSPPPNRFALGVRAFLFAPSRGIMPAA